MHTFATIFTGDVDAADWFFLFGAIFAALAGVLSIPTPAVAKASAWTGFLLAFAVAFTAFALLLL